ncbi:ABC transporter permease [uncultured Desulfovibrio sp.]|uniref:ABC transporter permease n=1 Tax=uncultured Desulfovibrio sp. TaxID=167968 RepID=UPI00262C0AA9|nr:ABC transporter permease [uncultured Desulfovibrio sp.]
MRTRIFFLMAPALVPVLFFIFWEGMADAVNNSLILPTLEEIGSLLAHPFTAVIGMGTLAGNIAISLVRVLCGYAAAVLIGVPLGVAMGYYAGLHRLLNLFLGMFRPIPPLAWVPLVLAWFGVSSLATVMGLPRSALYYYCNNLKISMLFIIFIGALFPILTSSVHGVQTVSRILVDSARVLGASEKDIFLKILLPAAAPSIVNGLRIGLGVAWMCLVSAEMLPGSLSGVGYLITHAYTVGRTDVVIAGMISISVVGALLDLGFQWVERRKYAWKQLSR